MNRNEEELQKSVEAGHTVEGSLPDVVAYEKVFSALRELPEVSLSHNFADKIVARVIEKQKRSDARDLFWFGMGMFFLLVAFIGTIIYTGYRVSLGFLEEMSGYSGLFVFGVAFIILLNWIDKRILSSKRTF